MCTAQRKLVKACKRDSLGMEEWVGTTSEDEFQAPMLKDQDSCCLPLSRRKDQSNFNWLQQKRQKHVFKALFPRTLKRWSCIEIVNKIMYWNAIMYWNSGLMSVTSVPVSFVQRIYWNMMTPSFWTSGFAFLLWRLEKLMVYFFPSFLYSLDPLWLSPSCSMYG